MGCGLTCDLICRQLTLTADSYQHVGSGSYVTFDCIYVSNSNIADFCSVEIGTLGERGADVIGLLETVS